MRLCISAILLLFLALSLTAQATELAKKGKGDKSLVPQQPPDWVNRVIESEAWVKAGETPLLTARAAETKARKMLRQQVGQLALGYNTTIDQAAAIDASIGEAADAAVQQARVTSTQYGKDKSASVKVELNLRRLWDELNR